MQSAPSDRLRIRLRKQVLLFGISVLLPALVLLFFIVRMNRQDTELRIGRAEEARQQKAAEIGRHLVGRMAAAEKAILQDLASDTATMASIYQNHPSLVFSGLIAGERLRMPWEKAGAGGAASGSSRYRALAAQAQQAEFEQNDLRRALSIWNRAISSSESASRASYIKLQQGRLLSKLGDSERAQALYREILVQAGELADEYGIPFCLYGADRLAASGSEVESVLERLEALREEIRWLPSQALFFIRDIIDQVQDRTQDPGHLKRSEDLRRSLKQALEGLERLESLQGFVLSWLQRRRSQGQVEDFSIWRSHGDIPWLAGIRDFGEGPQMVLLVFHGPRLLNAVLEEASLADTFPGSCRMTVDPYGEGYPAGAALEGIRLQFDEAEVSAWAPSSLPFPILYWSILILVVGFTAFGGYLLWRDIGRELATADMRSQFAASVSHELKTPLTSIRMFAEALTMGVQKQPEAQNQYLQTIISESERLSRLLNNVLDFSKIEQGTRTYRLEPISLEEVIHAAERAMAFPMDQHGFTLVVEMEPGLPLIPADRDALEQALLNLLHNAMKYSGESREIQLKLHRDRGSARIDVIDHGIGIAEEDQRAIMDKFFRAAGSENLKIPGTGLGLYIVSHIAQAHGGRVEVTSRPGTGSTFSLVLPLEAE